MLAESRLCLWTASWSEFASEGDRRFAGQDGWRRYRLTDLRPRSSAPLGAGQPVRSPERATLPAAVSISAGRRLTPRSRPYWRSCTARRFAHWIDAHPAFTRPAIGLVQRSCRYCSGFGLARDCRAVLHLDDQSIHGQACGLVNLAELRSRARQRGAMGPVRPTSQTTAWFW